MAFDITLTAGFGLAMAALVFSARGWLTAPRSERGRWSVELVWAGVPLLLLVLLLVLIGAPDHG